MNDFLEILLLLCSVCCFLTVIRITFDNYYDELKSENKLWLFMSHEYWLLPIIFLFAMKAGEYARGESSYIPWDEYHYSKIRHGEIDGWISFFVVSTVDILMFFGIAKYLLKEKLEKINYEHNEDIRLYLLRSFREYKKFYYIINVMFGLLLISHDNPIYKLMSLLVPPTDTP